MLASSAAVVAGMGMVAAASAVEVQVLEQELTGSFAVDLGGLQVDHKDLIFGVFVGQWVALVGAWVTGRLAQRRALVVQELNAKLMEANRNMRKQMNRNDLRNVLASQEFEDESWDEGLSPEPIQLLKRGKALLKEHKAHEAKAVFELSLSSIAGERAELHTPWKAERKAHRGLGAATMQLREYDQAEAALLRVVELCEANIPPGAERTELSDAYGALADMYTEWGKVDEAGQVYDKMIGEMATFVP